MWEAFQRFRILDSKAQRLFGRAVILLSWVKLSLRWRGFKATQALLRTKVPAGSSRANPNPADTVPRVARMVRAAAHHGLAHPNCLEESLVLWYLLLRTGIDAPLRIGVRRHQGNFEAHAWVEYEGTPLNQTEWTHPHYAAFEAEFSELPGENP